MAEERSSVPIEDNAPTSHSPEPASSDAGVSMPVSIDTADTGSMSNLPAGEAHSPNSSIPELSNSQSTNTEPMPSQSLAPVSVAVTEENSAHYEDTAHDIPTSSSLPDDNTDDVGDAQDQLQAPTATLGDEIGSADTLNAPAIDDLADAPSIAHAQDATTSLSLESLKPEETDGQQTADLVGENTTIANTEPIDHTQTTDLNWMNAGGTQIGTEEPVTGLTSLSSEPLLAQAEVEELVAPEEQHNFEDTNNIHSGPITSVIDQVSEPVVDPSQSTGTEGQPAIWQQPLQGDALQTIASVAESSHMEIAEDVNAPELISSPQNSQPLDALFDGPSASPVLDTEKPPSEELWGEETPASMPWETEVVQPSQDAVLDKLALDGTNEPVENSGFEFSGNTEDVSLDWASEVGLSSTTEPRETPISNEDQTRTEAVPNPQLGTNKEEIEDSWAKAFGSSESGPDGAWSSTFGDAFDDEDGLLEDPVMDSMPSQPSQPATRSPPMPPPPQPQAQAQVPAQIAATPVFGSAYSATPPIASQQSPSTPMQFFEELPLAPSRSRKPRQQFPAPVQPSAPPPMAQPRQTPPRTSSASPLQFRQPDRMDPFPPEPSVAVGPTASVYAARVPAQPTPPATSRYSPAPHVPPSFAIPQTGQSQPIQSSRYASSQANPPHAPAATIPPPPASRSPYAPPPATASPGREGRSSYAMSPQSFAQGPAPARPSAPPAPTQGVSMSSAELSNSPVPAVYPSAVGGQANNYTAIAPRSTPKQMNHPPGPPPAPPPSNRFAPRTSSPLAQHGYRPNTQSVVTGPTHGQYDLGADYSPSQPRANLTSSPTTSSPDASRGARSGFGSDSVTAESSFVAHGAERSTVYTPPPQLEMFTSIPPPKRPQTSSPKIASRNAPNPALERASTQAAYSSFGSTSGSQIPHSLPNNQSATVDFVLPSDGTEHDPLQRWKGAPIFHWGAGGLVITSLPSHIPRYGGGQTAPKMKPLAGEVKLQRAKEILSYREQMPPFPGPLRSKSKKKEVVVWLVAMISNLEKQIENLSGFSTGESTRLEEKLLLWEVMKVLIEFDGALAGNAAVESAVREALGWSSSSGQKQSANPVVHPASSMPTKSTDPATVVEIKKLLLDGSREKAIWYAVDNQLWAHAMVLAPSAGSTTWKQVIQEFVKNEVRSLDHDNQSLSALYQVLAGNWEESIDELVPLSARSGFQMVRTSATPAQARDAFEGLNKWRETLSLILGNRSVDDENGILSLGKLLAGSGRIEAAHVCYLFARSLVYFGGSDDPKVLLSLLGVDHNNPWSNGGVDIEAIQLSEVYEFALSLSPVASSTSQPHLQAYKLQHALSLAESGHRAEALQYLESITSAMKSTTRMSPYYNNTLILQVDDLQRRLSQSPKDGTSSWISRPTIGKVSSSMGTWFNSFVAGDENDGASTGSGHQSEAESGPFARIAGDTPIISRSASSIDLHAHHHAQAPPAGASRYAPAAAYAPRSSYGEDSVTQTPYTPYSASPEQRQGVQSARPTDNLSYPYGSPPKPSAFNRHPSHLSQYQSYSPQPRPESASSGPRPTSYEPYVPTVQEESSSYPGYNQDNAGGSGIQPESETTASSSNEPPQDLKTNGHSIPANGYVPGADAYQPPAAVSEAQSGDYESSSGYEPSSGGYAPPTSGYDPLGSSYDPPSGGAETGSGGYEPPSYQPYQPAEPDIGDTPSRPTVNDNDDDELTDRAAELKKKEKARRDKEADDAFRAAAEADAARDNPKLKRASSGWFGGIGGFFGGGAKKDPNAPVVHRAKLGEESSFYYDNETKKWVNRKAGSSPAPSTASGASAPPPPRSSAPPSRNVSGAVGPPPTSSPAVAPPLSREPSLKPPPSSFPVRDITSSGPPSRAGTPASNADSTASDSQALPPGVTQLSAETGPSSAPVSRPPTSMGDASSIDDLIGAPQARKGGTMRKGKKGQRYVDVMAK